MTRMCGTAPLDYAITQLKKTELCVEIGTYYGGWTKHLSTKFNNVITFQTPCFEKLNNAGTTSGEFSEDGLKWKKMMQQRLPEQYREEYSFDLLANQIKDLNNVMQILHNSPPLLEFNYNFDLCTIDITRDPGELYNQYIYWKNKGNKNSILLMGIYQPREYDNFSITQKQFLDSIEYNWHFYPQDNRYILIKL